MFLNSTSLSCLGDQSNLSMDSGSLPHYPIETPSSNLSTLRSSSNAFLPQTPSFKDISEPVFFLSTVLPKRSEKWLRHYIESCEGQAVIHQYPVTNAMDSHQHVVWEFRSLNLAGLVDSLEKLVKGIPEKNVPPQCVGRTPMRKVSYRLLIPSKLAYRIIGVQGLTIQRMREALSCDIFVSQTTCRLMRILCFVTKLQEYHRLSSGLRLVAFASALIGGMYPAEEIMREAEYELSDVELSVFKVMAKSREEQKLMTSDDPPARVSKELSLGSIPGSPANKSLNYPLCHEGFNPSSSRSFHGNEPRSFNANYHRFPSTFDARNFYGGDPPPPSAGDHRTNSMFMRSNSMQEFVPNCWTAPTTPSHPTFESGVDDNNWMQDRNHSLSRLMSNAFWSSDSIASMRPTYDKADSITNLRPPFDRTTSNIVIPPLNSINSLPMTSPPMNAQSLVPEYTELTHS